MKKVFLPLALLLVSSGMICQGFGQQDIAGPTGEGPSKMHTRDAIRKTQQVRNKKPSTTTSEEELAYANNMQAKKLEGHADHHANSGEGSDRLIDAAQNNAEKSKDRAKELGGERKRRRTRAFSGQD